jgi:hypothetical protein
MALVQGARGDTGTGPARPDTGRLVGLLREGSAQGRFDRYVPLTVLSEAGVVTRLPWLLEGDEAEGHFTRRSTGRAAADGADVFTGRQAALDRALSWLLADDPPQQVLVITGQPGGGKSAVIARAGFEAARLCGDDPRRRGLLFHARQADAGGFRQALADLFGTGPSGSSRPFLDEADELAAAQPRQRWLIILDALDEAASARDRDEIARLVHDLARRPWVRAAVATRPLSAQGPFGPDSVLREFGVTGPDDPQLLDLDAPAYFDARDLAAFAATLLEQRDQLFPAPPGGSWQTYRADGALRGALAAAIARRARGNFLVAGLTAHRLSEARVPLDARAPDFRDDALPATAGAALDRLLERRPDGVLLRGALSALAYAEGSGVDDATWLVIAGALGYAATQLELDRLRDSQVADYLLQSSPDGEGRATRLFHQALVDQLLRTRDRRGDQTAIYVALRLAVHAHAAGRLEELLADPEFLVVAHLQRLRRLAAQLDLADSAAGDLLLVLDRAGAEAEGMTARDRADHLAVTAGQLGLHDTAGRFTTLRDASAATI